LIGLVGRLWPQKRVKDAIWAVDLLRTFPYDSHLLVIGDGPHRARLEMFCGQVETRDKVRFLGRRDDVPRLLPHFDVLWSPSAYEGQSNAVMEAMAAGVPVVATDIPGTRDLVVHGETGFLVPAPERSAESAKVNGAVVRGLIERTAELLGNRDLARRMGEAGRRRMAEHFSVETMLRRHAELYRRLLAGEGRG
jgi:glycosyltransferase involved in cell wall biosynthesis